MLNKKLVALGEILIDFTPLAGQGKNPCFEQNPGGAPANALAAFCKLGGKAAFIGAVGDDSFGRFLKAVLDEQGIDSSSLVTKTEADTTLAFVHLNSAGDRSFSFYRRPGADTCLHTADVPADLIASADIFHFGTLSLCAEPARTATYYAIDQARKAGVLVSFDPNWRKPLWPSRIAIIGQIRRGLALSDLVKVSEEEAEFVTGIADPIAAGKRLLELSDTAKLIIVTLGAQGAAFVHKNACGTVPTFDRIPAQDTTGAGDSFWGSFLYRFLELGIPLSELDTASLTDICTFANAAGSLCASRRGAIPALASRAEIDELIAQGR